MSQANLHALCEVGGIVNAAAYGERAPSEAIEAVRDHFKCDSALLAISPSDDPRPHRVVAYDSYPDDVAAYLAGEYVQTCPGYDFAFEAKVPKRMCDTPFDFRDTRTYQEYLGPAGFKEGVTVPFEAGSQRGMLTMNSEKARPISHEACMALTLLAPVLARIAQLAAESRERDHGQCLSIDVDVASRRVLPAPGDCSVLPSLSEETLLTLATKLVRADCERMGFFERDAEDRWWHVQATRCRQPWRAGFVTFDIVHGMPPNGLTARELDILGLLCHGLKNNEIARYLSISLSTVKTHIEAIFGKLQQDNRVALVRRAIEKDLRTRLTLF